MQDHVFDVLIVGGGPVGFWLGCELRLAGLSVCIVERRLERTEQSRALTIHGRTLEVFALRGLAERFLAHGKPVPTGHFAVLDTRLDFSGFDSSFPFTLFIPQARTEAILEAHAIELGVTVRRGYSVRDVGQTDDQAWAVGSRDGEEFRIDCRYLVGADGARSIVRTSTGFDFPGVPGSRSFMLGDVQLQMPPGQPVISQVNEAGCLMVAPLGDGKHHRVVIFDPERADVASHRPVELQELLDSMRRVIGSDLAASAPIWLSRFTDETRLASHYRQGRIFLAGDAAHIHTPAGGQGMNVGIQDAMNLGWKLAAVVKNLAPQSLLDTYESERRPVGQQLYENTLAQTALMTVLTPATLALRGMVAGFLRNRDINRQVAGDLSGFSVAYPRPLLATEASTEQGTGNYGHRVPDFELELSEGVPTTLFGLMQTGRWVSVHLDGEPPVPAPSWLSPQLVESARIKNPQPVSAMAPVRALLVRPDGYSAGPA